MGRPRKYADDAERQAAYRNRYAMLTVRVTKETAETLARLSEHIDEPQTEVINSLIIFALLNRNWAKEGLFGKRLPNAMYSKTAPSKRTESVPTFDELLGDE